jgi:hypothetical protein
VNASDMAKIRWLRDRRRIAVRLRLRRNNRHRGNGPYPCSSRTCVDCGRVFQAIPVRRYHFHIRCGDRVLFDGTGRLLPGLTEAAREAERIARTLMHRDQSILETVDEWRLDVREPDDVLLFTLPFSEVHFEQFDDDLMAPDELPDTEALWSLCPRSDGMRQHPGRQR